eukprot:m.99002 g.99002  ORF g.99002 m.99002 type:complete len:77 (+) comp13134_c0_seq4:920-1150(+)
MKFPLFYPPPSMPHCSSRLYELPLPHTFSLLCFVELCFRQNFDGATQSTNIMSCYDIDVPFLPDIFYPPLFFHACE